MTKIPRMMKRIPITRAQSRVSRQIIMPAMTVNTIPTPDQIAYASPIDSVSLVQEIADRHEKGLNNL